MLQISVQLLRALGTPQLDTARSRFHKSYWVSSRIQSEISARRPLVRSNTPETVPRLSLWLLSDDLPRRKKGAQPRHSNHSPIAAAHTSPSLPSSDRNGAPDSTRPSARDGPEPPLRPDRSRPHLRELSPAPFPLPRAPRPGGGTPAERRPGDGDEDVGAAVAHASGKGALPLQPTRVSRDGGPALAPRKAGFVLSMGTWERKG